jgi:hypothetical protein
MKLSKNSEKLILFFTKNKHKIGENQSTRTKNIIYKLYKDLNESFEYLNYLKNKKNYFTISKKKISNAFEIKKPNNFNSKSFPEIIRKHIDDQTMCEITYSFSLNNRIIKIYFFVEENYNTIDLESFNSYVDAIIMWLFMLNKYASKQCVNSLTIYFYFTSLEKTLPNSNITILNEMNVNTAFTTTCPKISEIVVFRKEEWFKVLIHETFHNFALDFSDMNNTNLNNCSLNIFKVNSTVNIYEAYTEFWAEIINALFCSFFSLKDKSNVKLFLSNSEFFINYEKTYSFFQLVKTLNFMELTYKDLYLNTEQSKILRENKYKEKTNVLSYFVIKTVLINNYQNFLLWCDENNLSLLQFKKTTTNQTNFCKFIEKSYKISSMINSIDETSLFLKKLNKNKNKNLNYILSNLRMSICELG